MTRMIRKIEYREVEVELFGYAYNGRSYPTHDTVELVDVCVGGVSIYNLFEDSQVEYLRDKLLDEAVDSWQAAESEHADRMRDERRAA